MGKIDEVKNLSELHELLVELEESQNDPDLDMDCKWNDYYGVDLASLPVFGGEEPADTSEIWSWDDKNILVGCGGPKSWKIESRKS